ncbi:hypothetical protein DV711_06145 [Motiliproteus coralliicola]|uniref:Uncharacterized protein n=1 Tax=Motiliproteus coralliicola TaxID=2283196 RepID=A0A369WVI9_9GAMM|nr:hypothetical protein [Motiliproteus coralliicola]RDE25133.1 hypothetical protein DV711_06145 [Motiliproteus coralliicola]
MQEITPKQRITHIFSLIKGQVEPEQGQELSGEQRLWLAVIERSLLDLMQLPAAHGARLAHEFLTSSPFVVALGIDPEWLALMLKNHDLVPHGS